MTALPLPELSAEARRAAVMASKFPRVRYMGSKYKLVERLAAVFSQLGGSTAIDAFSGSGVVSYALKSLGYSVTSNDFLNFPGFIARAAVVNQGDALSDEEVESICGTPADDRDFIQDKFDGLYFTADDRKFLDGAWSHIELLEGHKRDLAIASLVLAAARKQPRGVFTFTDLRYDDGRRDLRLSLKEHFRETVKAYNGVVFDSGHECFTATGDVFDLPTKGYDIAYLDPPYAPPRDDNCYIKRYHFLEGLSVYWRGQTILENTKTKKLAKRYTPFSYKHSVEDALFRTFKQFHESTIVLSYSSNAVPDLATIERLLREVKEKVDVHTLEHKYSFGTHATAARRNALEYIIIGR
ncbi:DNA adenine methylase [Micromonospora sp. NPDC005087]|uniref:DNA adenine methylase n=1 Tax=Micromonospora sp. NPDC005087 TaxID=3364225 RepID=UPI0036B10225